ncbi:hypothetical protein [Alteribacillus sp. YIM 98480]|uniref:hypothetical protein n=1 Tax=Alteribacillus sp. YIM 98480 TaxID=2606599 RepID=UPI00131C4E28|nr:hypothetical protein [Alteribacillus sp. YIM 98480]
MVSVKVHCSNCEKDIELAPDDNKKASMLKSLIDNDMYIYGEEIDTSSIGYDEDESVERALTDAKSVDEVRNLLNNIVMDTVEVEPELKSVRIQCTDCQDNLTIEF